MSENDCLDCGTCESCIERSIAYADTHDTDAPPPSCKSCGVAWIEHAGVQALCARLESALSALRVIRIWASFRGGVELVPEHVVKLCDKTLAEAK